MTIENVNDGLIMIEQTLTKQCLHLFRQTPNLRLISLKNIPN